MSKRIAEIDDEDDDNPTAELLSYTHVAAQLDAVIKGKRGKERQVLQRVKKMLSLGAIVLAEVNGYSITNTVDAHIQAMYEEYS